MAARRTREDGGDMDQTHVCILGRSSLHTISFKLTVARKIDVQRRLDTCKAIPKDM